MQADRDGLPKVGAMMRVFDCDRSNKLQRFDYNAGVIRLQGEQLCAAFRGIVGDVNQDPIILKPCNDETTIWVTIHTEKLCSNGNKDSKLFHLILFVN